MNIPVVRSCCVCLSREPQTVLHLLPNEDQAQLLKQMLSGIDIPISHETLICIICSIDLNRAWELKKRANEANGKQALDVIGYNNRKEAFLELLSLKSSHPTPGRGWNLFEIKAEAESPATPPATVIKKEKKSTYPCSICSRKLSSKIRLRDHVQNIHKGTKRFFCDYCNCGFWGKYSLARHCSLHVNGKITTCYNQNKPNAVQDMNLVCWKENCKQTFKTQRELSFHYLEHFSGGGDQLVCDCGSVFTKMANLRRHFKRIHQKSKATKKL